MIPIRAAIVLLLLALTLPGAAQDQSGIEVEEERSLFLGFVEDQLSTPNRQIRISGIEGVLSSNARIGSITVADREGVWLRIVDASIEWSRLALLRGRLDVTELAAERIEMSRNPLPEEGLPPPEARSFSLPDLPLAIDIASLRIDRAVFAQDVFGLGSELAVEGRLRLEGGSLDSALEIERQDGPGGRFTLAARYDNEDALFDLDLALSEPENGVVANLLGIEGRPPIMLTLAGAGPVGDLTLDLALDADGQRVLAGTTQLRQGREGLGFSADVAGRLAQLIPAPYRPFFGAETSLTAHGVVKQTGGVRLDAVDLQSAALALRGAAETEADGFLRRLTLDARIAGTGDQKVVLPVPGGQTGVDHAALTLNYGDSASEEWSGNLDIGGLATPTFGARSVQMNLGGLAQNVDQPAERSIDFSASGGISGIVAVRADVAEALGDALTIDVTGTWRAGAPVRLERAEIAGPNLVVSAVGEIAQLAFRGDLDIATSSIAPFSDLAGRRLSGRLDLQASGELEPVSGAFDLVLDGEAGDVDIDHRLADGLLGGTTSLSGRLTRGTGGIGAEQLRIANEQIELVADGSFASQAADFDFSFSLADLALLSDQASGRLSASGRAQGRDGPIALTLGADVSQGRVVGRRLSEAALGFEGTLDQGALNGQITGLAFVDGVRVQLSSAVALAEGTRTLRDLRFTAGGAEVTGHASQDPSGLYRGELAVEAASIDTAAALFLIEATGALQANVTLMAEAGRQSGAIRAAVDDLRTADIRLGAARLNARIEDLFAVPMIQGTLAADDISMAGIDVARLEATAERSGQTTAFEGTATLDNGTTAAANGSLTPLGTGYRVGLERVELEGTGLSARLLKPGSVQVEGRSIALDPLDLAVGEGRVSVSGTIADELDLRATIRALPLEMANSVRSDLELAGTVDGSVTIAGTRARPDIGFDLRGDTIAAAALKQAGLRSITLNATGHSSASRLSLDARMTSPDGLRAGLSGSVPLDDGPLALEVDLAAFPLAIANAVLADQSLSGMVTGSARLAGPLDAPRADFQLRGADLSASALSSLGIGPLTLEAGGRYGDGVITLATATVRGADGIALTGSGRIPLTESSLSVSISGQAPLSLANRLLADRGAQASGTVSLDLGISGSLERPLFNGSVSTSGAQFVDPMSNIHLREVALSARITGDQITVDAASAALATGGMVGLTGTVSLDASANFPGNLSITLDQARYVDEDLVIATVDANLAMTGPLARDPLLSGTVRVERAEISVPERLGGGVADLDVIHSRPPAAVTRTLERARMGSGVPVPSGRPSVVRLDVQIDAPNQIFVRGRGLDVELGGQVHLSGPLTTLQPVGGFEIIRGRLSILSQRISFDEGRVTLVGDLDPFLDFLARSERDAINVFITVRGRVSDLDVSFSSQPELPEDEVLARLIFNRGINELSPVQLAQLALAAAELAGGSNASILGNLRQATGLDDIDIVTNPEGDTALRVGRYIQDNIYLGVEAGTGGTTRGTINLDITKELKVKGGLATDGGSDLGIFYEKDY